MNTIYSVHRRPTFEEIKFEKIKSWNIKSPWSAILYKQTYLGLIPYCKHSTACTFKYQYKSIFLYLYLLFGLLCIFTLEEAFPILTTWSTLNIFLQLGLILWAPLCPCESARTDLESAVHRPSTLTHTHMTSICEDLYSPEALTISAVDKFSLGLRIISFFNLLLLYTFGN
jgi:hypothetical protein